MWCALGTSPCAAGVCKRVCLSVCPSLPVRVCVAATRVSCVLACGVKGSKEACSERVKQGLEGGNSNTCLSGPRPGQALHIAALPTGQRHTPGLWFWRQQRQLAAAGCCTLVSCVAQCGDGIVVSLTCLLGLSQASQSSCQCIMFFWVGPCLLLGPLLNVQPCQPPMSAAISLQQAGRAPGSVC